MLAHLGSYRGDREERADETPDESPCPTPAAKRPEQNSTLHITATRHTTHGVDWKREWTGWDGGQLYDSEAKLWLRFDLKGDVFASV